MPWILSHIFYFSLAIFHMLKKLEKTTTKTITTNWNKIFRKSRKNNLLSKLLYYEKNNRKKEKLCHASADSSMSASASAGPGFDIQ